MKKKRVVALVVASVLAIGSLLSGCGSQQVGQEAENMVVTGESEEGNQGNYLETSEELPYDTKLEELVAVAVKRSDSNQLHLFTRNQTMQYKEYSRQENGEWETMGYGPFIIEPQH